MKSKFLKIALVTERTRSYGRGICEGVASYAQCKSNWSLVLVDPTDRLPEIENIRKCDGIIARVFSEDMAARLKESGVPTVDIFGRGALDRTSDFPFADSDHAAVAKLAARHFLSRRFHSFAFCGYDGVAFSNARRDAFAAELAASHHAVNMFSAPKDAVARYGTLAANEKLGFDGNTAPLSRWLAKLPRHTAVFCANDILALQVLQLCREEDIAVPNDLAILGVDNDQLLCSFATPAISSIDPDPSAIGFAAAEMLDAMIATGKAPESRTIEPKGVVTRLSSEIYPIEPAWLSNALTFIHRNVSNNLSASDVFKHLDLSHTIVEQTFRRVLQTTVQKEIIKSRMDEARHLLSTTDLSISDVSRLSGFSSAEYFCRTFVAHHSKSPGEWRKSAK